MARIVTLTMNPAVDKSAAVENVERNRKLRCTDVRRDPGGGGINVSRAIARLGGESTAVYVGGGLVGTLLERLLDDEGLTSRRIPVSDSIRENFMVVETSSGSQYRFGMPGPELSDKEWKTALDTVADTIEEGGFLIASGSLPPGAPRDFYARLGDVATGSKTSYIVDTYGESLVRAVESGVFLIKPNIDELGAIVGDENMEGPEIRAAARKLTSEGKAEHVVVSLGAGGVIYVSGETVMQVSSPTVPIRSRIGAGDSMIGAIVFALDRGRPVVEAVRYGVAAGAAAVMTDGTELCRKEDVERLYEDME